MDKDLSPGISPAKTGDRHPRVMNVTATLKPQSEVFLLEWSSVTNRTLQIGEIHQIVIVVPSFARITGKQGRANFVS